MKKFASGLSAIAALLVAQPDIAAHAKGGGTGMHSFHFSGHFKPFQQHRHFARHNQSQRWLGYGSYGWGYYAIPSYDYWYGNNDVTGSVPTTVIYAPVRAASCRKVQESMTVPSEEGGTRQVTVTRCQ